MRSLRTPAMIRSLAVLLTAPLVMSFALYDAGGFLGYTWNKWGDPATGTPAIVYWSLMPVGTEGSDYCAPGCTTGAGTSTLTLPNFYDWNTQSFRSLALDSVEGRKMIRDALRAWGATAGVTFIEVADDTGVPINDPQAEPPDTGHIRIGVFEMGFGGPAGAGFAPPPNGFIPDSEQLATGAGDIILNSTYAYQAPTGAEGTPLDAFPVGGGFFLNDLPGLILHELGHAIGIDHSDVATAVMCGFPHDCTYNDVATYQINRIPDADDVSALQTLYGAAIDTDLDTVPDAIDNCQVAMNTNQLDADGDGYGNRCDADLNNSGGVNAADLAIFRAAFGSSNANANLDGLGSVNAADLAIFRARFGLPPGPSGLVP
jgi:Matrixin